MLGEMVGETGFLSSVAPSVSFCLVLTADGLAEKLVFAYLLEWVDFVAGMKDS